jgi:hypothetical protein
VQTTSLRAGSRARVMPCATISESHRMARRAQAPPARADEAGAERDMAVTSTHPQA